MFLPIDCVCILCVCVRVHVAYSQVQLKKAGEPHLKLAEVRQPVFSATKEIVLFKALGQMLPQQGRQLKCHCLLKLYVTTSDNILFKLNTSHLRALYFPSYCLYFCCC